ncbi:hypothetical protein PRIPAC_74099, partial [Pristionchus pacificus]|uniref:Ion channel n=1 Tax=Pristionchus pacificus TaxID=54126 RepID=A0A2A6C767_PRIPA
MASVMDGGGRVSMGRLLMSTVAVLTVACLARIAEGGKLIKIIFTLILFAMFIMCTYASVGCLRKFISYPSSTELALVIQSLKFPRISFCNENPLKRSQVEFSYAKERWDNALELFPIGSMIRQYEGTARGEMATTSFGLMGSPRALHQMRRAQAMLRLQMAQLTKAVRKESGVHIRGPRHGMLHCWGDMQLYGNCYPFISDVDITRPGTQQQFRMLFTQDWPNPTSRKQAMDYLPTSDSAAIWAVIHQPDEFPDFSKNGIRIGVGTQAIVSLSKANKDHHRLGAAYGNCIEQDMESDNYYQNYTYTMNTCQQSCLQRHAHSKCGCVDPLFLKAKNHTHCTTPQQ